jgi:hypothetical protein
LKNQVVGRKHQGRKKKKKYCRQQTRVLISVRTTYSWKRSLDEVESIPEWPFGCWNQPHALFKDGRAANTCCAHINNIFIFKKD